jgi:hypothetical protein
MKSIKKFENKKVEGVSSKSLKGGYRRLTGQKGERDLSIANERTGRTEWRSNFDWNPFNND